MIDRILGVSACWSSFSSDARALVQGKRQRRYGLEFYRLVTEVYTEALALRVPPLAAVAERCGAGRVVTKSTAAQWVARARTIGFLEPTTRGRTSEGAKDCEGSTTQSNHLTWKATSRLGAWRERNGLTLREVSDLTGISESMLCRVESGERQLAPLTCVQLARNLGVQVKEIFEPRVTPEGV